MIEFAWDIVYFAAGMACVCGGGTGGGGCGGAEEYSGLPFVVLRSFFSVLHCYFAVWLYALLYCLLLLTGVAPAP